MLRAAKSKLRTNVKDRVSRAVETTRSAAGTGTVDTSVRDAQNVAQLGHSAVDTAQSGAVGLIGGRVASSGALGAHDQVVEDDFGHEGEEKNNCLATVLKTRMAHKSNRIKESTQYSIGESGISDISYRVCFFSSGVRIRFRGFFSKSKRNQSNNFLV